MECYIYYVCCVFNVIMYFYIIIDCLVLNEPPPWLLIRSFVSLMDLVIHIYVTIF